MSDIVEKLKEAAEHGGVHTYILNAARLRILQLEAIVKHTKQGQRETDVKIIEAYIDESMATDYENQCFKSIIKQIKAS